MQCRHRTHGAQHASRDEAGTQAEPRGTGRRALRQPGAIVPGWIYSEWIDWERQHDGNLGNGGTYGDKISRALPID